jgi:hypothetical protein
MEEETKDEGIKQEGEVKAEEAGEGLGEEVQELPEAVEPGQEEKPLDKMTAPELKEIALNIPGATGVTAMKKDQLLALIKEYRGIKDEEPPKKKKTGPKDLGVSKADLKQKIVKLREYKQETQKDRDRKKANILRRRINRLKKRTRKAD